MNIYYDPQVVDHHPGYEVFNGGRVYHADKPARVRSVVHVLASLSWATFVSPKSVSKKVIRSVHSGAYLSFLDRMRSHLGSIYPSVFFEKGFLGNPSDYSLESIAGFFGYDMYTPFSSSAVSVGYASAASAFSAAQNVFKGDMCAYALCRPAGHHAESGRVGGYSYVNNAAVSAEYLAQQGARVAILDFDYHHGNGTQEIFFDRSDVLFVSLHARPEVAFPYFSGFAREIGEGKGRGYNLNIPLEKKTKHLEYFLAFDKGVRKIRKFDPDYLVVSAGFDIHRSDPIAGFQLGDRSIRELGQHIAYLPYPKVLIQEGGYNTDTIGKLVRIFLEPFV